jgi:hypothetical protein
MRRIKNYSDELDLIALQRGLRNGGPGTLKYDSYRKNCRTFNKFLSFAEGYMRGEDNTESPRRASRSLSPRARKGYNPARRDNWPRDFRNEGCEEGHKWGKLNIDAEYRPHFTSYVQFDQPTQDLLKLIHRKFKLPRPIDIQMFKIHDENSYCQYHRSKGHFTEDCMQLRDILEKIARQRDLTQYIKLEFYRKYPSRYNGKDRKYRREISKKDYENLKGFDERHPYREESGRSNHNSSSTRQPTPIVNVIAGGIPLGGDTIRQRWSYNRAGNVHSVPEMHKKRPHPEEAITFSEKNETWVSQPHDDALVLNLKINAHQVRRILIDTESFADVMYFDAFIKMGYNPLHLVKVNTPLVNFTGAAMVPEGLMRMRVEFGTPPRTTFLMIDFLVVKVSPAYNIILGRKTLWVRLANQGIALEEWYNSFFLEEWYSWLFGRVKISFGSCYSE